jgi:hypothetical protein
LQHWYPIITENIRNSSHAFTCKQVLSIVLRVEVSEYSKRSVNPSGKKRDRKSKEEKEAFRHKENPPKSFPTSECSLPLK